MATDKTAFILAPTRARWFWFPATKSFTSFRARTQAVPFRWRKSISKATARPKHIHLAEDESFYTMEGEAKFLVGEKTFVAKAGAFVLVPKGTPRTFTRVEQIPAKFLVVYSPTGFEKFFDEAVDLDVTDTETYVAKAEALAKKYNMKVVSPPLEGLAAFRHSPTSQIWLTSW